MDRVTSDLWISNRGYEKKRQLGYKATAADTPGVCLYEDDGDYLVLPRGYQVPLAVEDVCPEYIDERPQFPCIPFPRFVRTLRPEQEAPMRSLYGDADKLLCLGCGKGKTTLALCHAQERRKKTLVIVDRDFLVGQWIGEIEACFDGEAGVVGVIQADQRSVGECFTVAMVHTLSQQDFEPDFYDQFGLIIVDEAHCMGAPTFAEVLPNFPGERLLLSATPKRADGMEAVFMLHAGGMVPCYTDLARDRSSEWYFIHAPPYLDERELKRCFRYAPGLGKPILHRPIYETFVSKVPAFNSIILGELMKAANAKRSVLILGTRVEQLGFLRYILAPYASAGLVTGEVKGDKRSSAFNRQMVFATSKIASRALDIPRLDMLVLLYPTDDVNFLRQAVGRIDREFANKRSPIVLVFCHDALRRKEREMESAIRSIDPKARVHHVDRKAG